MTYKHAMMGLFIDTFVILTLTALVIILAGTWRNPALEGLGITQAAFTGTFHGFGTVFIAPQLDYPQTLGPNSIIIKTKENDKYIYYLLLSRYI